MRPPSHTTTPPAPHGQCLYHERLAERARNTKDELGEIRAELERIAKTLRWMFLVLGTIGAGAWGAPDILQGIAKVAAGGTP